MTGRPLPFALDPESVRLGRRALGGVLFLDLALRARDLQAHYSDLGVLPGASLDLLAWDFVWSLHTLSGSALWAGLLFALALVAAALLVLDRAPSLAALVSWLLLTSLHARNPLLRDGQDDLLRALLLWHVLLSRAGGSNPSAASVGYRLQLVLLYAVGVVVKLRSPWWLEGQALYWVLNLTRYQTPLAPWLLGQGELLPVLSYGVLGVELLLPLFLLAPGLPRRLRTGLVASAVLLHLAFMLFLELGVFSIACAAAWLVLLPGDVVRRAGAGRDGASPPAAPAPTLGSPHARAHRVLGYLPSAAAVIVAALVVLANAPVLHPGLRPPRPLALAIAALGLQQNWGVFAPSPVTALARSDGWYVLAGSVAPGAAGESAAPGARVAVLGEGGPLSFERPARPDPATPNHRWRQYLANLRVTWPRGSGMALTIEASREAWLAAECRRWNQRAARLSSPAVLELELIYLNELVPPPGTPRAPAERITLHRRACEP